MAGTRGRAASPRERRMARPRGRGARERRRRLARRRAERARATLKGLPGTKPVAITSASAPESVAERSAAESATTSRCESEMPAVETAPTCWTIAPRTVVDDSASALVAFATSRTPPTTASPPRAPSRSSTRLRTERRVGRSFRSAPGPLGRGGGVGGGTRRRSEASFASRQRVKVRQQRAGTSRDPRWTRGGSNTHPLEDSRTDDTRSEGGAG